MTLVAISQGDSPIVLGKPHGGIFVPDDIAARLNTRGQELSDTDWHIDRLYDGLLQGVTTVSATFHRYVIDANRDPAGASLYPGQNTTMLCPTTDFDGIPIWKDGQEPSIDEIDSRQTAYHQPYHEALKTELERVKNLHGFAVLYDCHSIRSEIPFLFDGTLPIFSIGTNDGVTCAQEIQAATVATCKAASGFNSVVNGRFKGGWTTRNYGKPGDGIHAIQMELAQRAYMIEAAPWAYATEKAAILRPHLATILNRINDIARSGALQL